MTTSDNTTVGIALATLKQIAEMDGESNEWDAVDRYHLCQEFAQQALDNIATLRPDNTGERIAALWKNIGGRCTVCEVVDGHAPDCSELQQPYNR